MACTYRSLMTLLFSLLAVCVRFTYFVITPLWLDFFKKYAIPDLNITNSSQENINAIPLFPSIPIKQNVNSFFIIFGQWLVTSTLFGMLLIGMKIFTPNKITDTERNYPKKIFFIIGFSQGISSILFNFALSGSRSPPYLESLLTNFEIPVQFIIRYVMNIINIHYLQVDILYIQPYKTKNLDLLVRGQTKTIL